MCVIPGERSDRGNPFPQIGLFFRELDKYGERIATPVCALARNDMEALCRLPELLPHDVGKSRDELSVGGLAPVWADSVAEEAAQDIHVAPGPGHLDEMPDAPLHPGGGGVELGGDLGIEAESFPQGRYTL